MGINLSINIRENSYIAKKVIRIISACKYRDRTSNYFKELHILKFPDINFLQTALYMYNVDHKLLPSHLLKTFYRNNEITPTTPDHQTITTWNQ